MGLAGEMEGKEESFEDRKIRQGMDEYFGITWRSLREDNRASGRILGRITPLYSPGTTPTARRAARLWARASCMDCHLGA